MGGIDELPVGTLVDGVTAWVDAGGSARPPGEPWRLEWWIGAGDRWHRPVVAPSQRRTNVEGCPVVEISLRVPGGDVTARIAASPSGVTTIEVENLSGVAVALGWVVTGGGSSGLGAGRSHLVGDHVIWLDRDPRQIESAADLLGAAEADVEGATVAVVPLTHTGRRVARIAPAPRTAGAVEPDSPPVESVVAGWRAVAETHARFDVATPGASERLRAASMLLELAGGTDAGRWDRNDPPDVAEVVRAAASVGATSAADLLTAVSKAPPGGRGRRGSSGSTRSAARLAALVAAADAAGRDDAGWHRFLLDVAAEAHALARRPSSARDALVATGAAVGLLRAADQAGAADELARVRRLLDCAELSDARAPTEADPADAIVGAARLVNGWVERMVVVDDVQIDILPGWEDHWWGAPVEVHGLATSHGRISFALRWHGDRPALLWELDQPGPHRDPIDVSVTASALDPAWHGSGRRGEALLGAVARVADASFS